MSAQVSQHATSISSRLNLAVRAACAAGQVIRDGYGELNVVEQKDVGDLVSEVDHEADRVATRVIREECGLPILSEEINHTAECDDMWIVDPLDASSAFLMQAGTQYPAVLVAAQERGETSLGVCYFPLTDDWFYAQRGRGAWRNGKRLICDRSENLSEVWVEMNQYGNARWETGFFKELRDRLRSTNGARLVTSNVPNSGVAMRIGTCESTLAVAVHDNNPDNPKQGPWDIAAPQVILEEAGGVFCNPDGQRSNPFVPEPVIVARSNELAKSVLDLLTREPAGS